MAPPSCSQCGHSAIVGRTRVRATSTSTWRRSSPSGRTLPVISKRETVETSRGTRSLSPTNLPPSSPPISPVNRDGGGGGGGRGGVASYETVVALNFYCVSCGSLQVCVCVCVAGWLCVCVCVCVCLCVCLHTYIHIYRYTHTHTCVCVCVFLHVYIYMCTHTHTHTHTHCRRITRLSIAVM